MRKVLCIAALIVTTGPAWGQVYNPNYYPPAEDYGRSLERQQRRNDLEAYRRQQQRQEPQRTCADGLMPCIYTGH